MFVTVTTINMPRAAMGPVLDGFRHGSQALRQFPGFLGFELWTSEDTLQAVAQWDSREAVDAYKASDLFKAHHGGGTGNGSAAQYDAEVVIAR
ncbi:MAG TPA: antibiotic biosynthesis monooxygenase family protein [Chloroflexota bacterium]|nr:antibiotic biosynthesis monooxygenase family protein [Chloroflexota bacterium]